MIYLKIPKFKEKREGLETSDTNKNENCKFCVMGRKIVLMRLFDHRQHEVQTELHGSHHLSRTPIVSSITSNSRTLINKTN